MARKPLSTSTIYIYLFLCTCLAAPFLSANLCRLVSAILIVRFLMFLIQAAVTSDARRSYAIGFLIAAQAYFTGVLLTDKFELRHGKDAILPTTALLTSLTEPLRPPHDIPASTREAQFRQLAQKKGAAFLVLGQLMFTYLFGICGGNYASRLGRSTPRTTLDEHRQQT